MIKIDNPPVQGLEAHARYVVSQVMVHGDSVCVDFNGTPMAGNRNEDVKVILLRWHYERLLIQIADGTVNVRDYADGRYTR